MARGKSELRRACVVGNTHRPKPKWFRKGLEPQRQRLNSHLLKKGEGKRVKRGNLYAEKGQIGKNAYMATSWPGSSILSGRPLYDFVGNGKTR